MSNELIVAMARDAYHVSAAELDEAPGWDQVDPETKRVYRSMATAAYSALREKLVPVGWIKPDGNGGWLIHSPYKTEQADSPLYHLPEIANAD